MKLIFSKNLWHFGPALKQDIEAEAAGAREKMGAEVLGVEAILAQDPL
jgi:hypothetical protein